MAAVVGVAMATGVMVAPAMAYQAPSQICQTTVTGAWWDAFQCPSIPSAWNTLHIYLSLKSTDTLNQSDMAVLSMGTGSGTTWDLTPGHYEWINTGYSNGVGFSTYTNGNNSLSGAMLGDVCSAYSAYPANCFSTFTVTISNIQNASGDKTGVVSSAIEGSHLVQENGSFLFKQSTPAPITGIQVIPKYAYWATGSQMVVVAE